MPFTWALNSTNWDLSIRNGKLQAVTGVEEVKQRILVTLWHYWEEYFLNVPSGVPWYELILGSKDKKMVEALLRKTILSVPGVTSIQRFFIQDPQGTGKDYSIFADIEVFGNQPISIFTTTAQLEYTNYLTTDLSERITTDDGTYLTA